MQPLGCLDDAYSQEQIDVDRTEGAMEVWSGSDVLGIGPIVNSHESVHLKSSVTVLIPKDMGAATFMSLGIDMTDGGVNFGNGLGLDLCGDGGVSAGAEVEMAPWTFPTPPRTAASRFNQAPALLPPPRAANLHSHSTPRPPHYHLPRHHTALNRRRPHTAPAHRPQTAAGAPVAIVPGNPIVVCAPPAFAFSAPELVIEELPDTWKSDAASISFAVLTSPHVTFPSAPQPELASSPPSPDAIGYWSYTPPATSHSARSVNPGHTRLVQPSHVPMSESAAAPAPHCISRSSLGASAPVEPTHPSEASAPPPVPMTTSAASSPTSPRIQTPRASQLPVGLDEMGDKLTGCQTGPPGTDLEPKCSLPVRRLESPHESRQTSSLSAVASASSCTIPNNQVACNDGLSVPTHTPNNINTTAHTPTSLWQLYSSLSSPSHSQHQQQLVRRSMVASQEQPPTFDNTASTARATPTIMSAATAYNTSPVVTAQNALLAGANPSIHNTSPHTSSLNTVAAHSVYAMTAQSSAPGNPSGPFATGQDGASQASLPPMAAAEPGMAHSAYYGASPVRPYPPQAAVYPQSQAQPYHHPTNQGQYQPQYADSTGQATGNQHQTYHDAQYTSPKVGYHQPTNPIHAYNTASYSHGRSDSLGSWHASDSYDYGRHTSSSSADGGGRASGKGEPFLLPNEEELPRPAPSYAALIGEALLLADPPHQLYVSEISESIKNRYPFYRQFPSKIYNGVRHQTSMCKAFVKIPRPFGDQSGGARKWAIRSGCQTWFRDGDYHPPVSPPSSGHSNKAKGGKKRSTGNSKQLALGHDPMSPNLNSANGPSDGPPWDPVRSPLPWLQRFRASRLGPQQVPEQQLVPRAQAQAAQSGYGFVPTQYTQPSAYGMTPAYPHHYGSASGGSGEWGAYQQHPGAHYYPSPPEHGGSWRPPAANFAFAETSFPRHRPALLNSDDSSHDEVRARSRGQPSPAPEGEYQFNASGEYPKRETSTPLSSPPPGAEAGDA